MSCEPVGIKEIAARLELPTNVVKGWRTRGQLPPPRWRAGGADLWNWPTIKNWADKRNGAT